tara:strand:- start:266 stop:808 length:543 start_codon:yes stop_codon:yes gene_type:complete
MALTKSVWVKTSGSGFNKWECTVVQTTGETDSYTLKTPSELDGSRQWSMAMSAAATADAEAIPLDLWAGYNSDFAISGDSTTVTAGSNGYNVQQIIDDCVLAVTTLKYSWIFDPELPVANVVTVAAIANGLKVRTPIAPYYAFNLDGGSTLAATTITWTIFQDVDGGGGISQSGVGADPS